MPTYDSQGRILYKLQGVTYLAEHLMLRVTDWYFEIRLKVDPTVLVGTTTQLLEGVEVEE